MCQFVPIAAHSSEIETAVASDKIVLGKISLEDFYQSTLLTHVAPVSAAAHSLESAGSVTS